MTLTGQKVSTGLFAATLLFGMGTAALADIQTGDEVGLSISDIARSLENNGYEIREIEVKSDHIEVEVSLEGDRLEIKIDPRSGLVTRIEDD